LQSYVVYVFLWANVESTLCLFVPLKALLLHLLEMFNEHINDDDDDELKLGSVVVLGSLLKLIDLGFKRSRVMGTGSSSLRIFGLLPNPR